jgi:hypothetical protein
MAHFAKLDENNFVIDVIVLDDAHESQGETYIINDLNLNGKWIQTSYNSRGNVHYDPNTGKPSGKPALRKNYACIGYYYDSILDAFIPPKPYDSWQLNESSGLWSPPKPYPNDGKPYFWDEGSKEWVLE